MKNQTCCPLCGSDNSFSHHPEVSGVEVCSCGARFTSRPIYLGESYRVVLPLMADGSLEGSCYFDFETLGSAGLGRRHGWFDLRTRLVLQAG